MKKLYVVGMGPGDHDSVTIRADRVEQALDRAEDAAGEA